MTEIAMATEGAQETPLTKEERTRERENEFARKLVESAQVLAHQELSQLETLAEELTRRPDGMTASNTWRKKLLHS